MDKKLLLIAVAATVVVAGATGAIFLLTDDAEPEPPRDTLFHHHSALGVYACDLWLGGPQWPYPDDDFGIHSHDDGLVHVHPHDEQEATDVTLGRYFTNGGWSLSTSAVEFLDADLHAGDECGGEPGVVRWSVNGVEQDGDPAAYEPQDRDEIVVAFVPAGVELADLGAPPSTETEYWAHRD